MSIGRSIKPDSRFLSLSTLYASFLPHNGYYASRVASCGDYASCFA